MAILSQTLVAYHAATTTVRSTLYTTHTDTVATAVVTKQAYTDQPEIAFGTIELQTIDTRITLLVNPDGVYIRTEQGMVQIGTSLTIEGINPQFTALLDAESEFLLARITTTWKHIPLGLSVIVTDTTTANIAELQSPPSAEDTIPDEAIRCDVCNNTGYSALIPGEALAPCFRCTSNHENYAGVNNVTR